MIVKQDNRIIIYHNESERFRRVHGDARTERRPTATTRRSTCAPISGSGTKRTCRLSSPPTSARSPKPTRKRRSPITWFLEKWNSWARRSRLEPKKKVAATIDRHRDGILAWFDSGIANGLIESIKSLVQAAKAKARGFRNRKTLKTVTYLIAGKLDLRLPT